METQKKTYHLIVEEHNDPSIEKYCVKAINIYEAIVHLTEREELVKEEWNGDAKKFCETIGNFTFSTSQPKTGHYGDDDYTIGFGNTYQEACVQFVELRLSQGC
ncbi:MAG: hypothetical protein QQN41_04075 [Nitrosopumilus sp.]